VGKPRVFKVGLSLPRSHFWGEPRFYDCPATNHRMRGPEAGRETRATTEQAPELTIAGPTGWTFKRVAAGCALVGGATLAAALILTSGGGGYRYRLLFQTAGQLVPGNQVQIGGVPVGSIDSISLADDSTAQVDISVNQQLHQGSTATVRATSLSGIANHYVSISPGPNNLPALGSGSTIGLAQTQSPVELDAVFNTFKPNVRQGLRNFIKGNAAIYAGVGPQANQTYRYFAPALGSARRWMEEIGRDQGSLERFVVNSSALVTAISQRAPQLADAVSNAHPPSGPLPAHPPPPNQPPAALPHPRAAPAPSPLPPGPPALPHPPPAPRRGRSAGRTRQARDQGSRSFPRAAPSDRQEVRSDLQQPGPVGQPPRQAERRSGHP